VFSGEFHPLLDQKKRLTIPARWRSDSLEELYIIKSLVRGCLVAMPEEGMEIMRVQAEHEATSTEEKQIFTDQLYSQAVICPVDSQGRMVLPDDLCRFAGIEKELVLTGSGRKFDLWAPRIWQERQRAVEATYATMQKRLGL
jgi:MraZ protein